METATTRAKPVITSCQHFSKESGNHDGNGDEMLRNSGLRGEKLNYKSVAKEISKTPFFLAPEVQWASKFAVFVRFTFPLNVSNHAHIWYVT